MRKEPKRGEVATCPAKRITSTKRDLHQAEAGRSLYFTSYSSVASPCPSNSGMLEKRSNRNSLLPSAPGFYCFIRDSLDISTVGYGNNWQTCENLSSSFPKSFANAHHISFNIASLSYTFGCSRIRYIVSSLGLHTIEVLPKKEMDGAVLVSALNDHIDIHGSPLRCISSRFNLEGLGPTSSSITAQVLHIYHSRFLM